MSPRNSCSVSIVAGLRVATASRRRHISSIWAKEELTRVVIRGGLIYNEAMGATENGIRSVAGYDEHGDPYDFFVRKIAVAVSFGPG